MFKYYILLVVDIPAPTIWFSRGHLAPIFIDGKIETNKYFKSTTNNKMETGTETIGILVKEGRHIQQC